MPPAAPLRLQAAPSTPLRVAEAARGMAAACPDSPQAHYSLAAALMGIASALPPMPGAALFAEADEEVARALECAAACGSDYLTAWACYARAGSVMRREIEGPTFLMRFMFTGSCSLPAGLVAQSAALVARGDAAAERLRSVLPERQLSDLVGAWESAVRFQVGWEGSYPASRPLALPRCAACCWRCGGQLARAQLLPGPTAAAAAACFPAAARAWLAHGSLPLLCPVRGRRLWRSPTQSVSPRSSRCGQR